MSEIYPVLIGVAATAFVMVLSNVSRRREKDFFKHSKTWGNFRLTLLLCDMIDRTCLMSNP